MNNFFVLCRQMIVFAHLLIFTFASQSSRAELKAIPSSIKEKHDLHIFFPEYSLFENGTNINEAKLLDALSSGTVSEVIPGKLSAIVNQKPEAITIKIPFNGNMISVELIRANILTEDFSVITPGNQEVPYTPGVYYRGIVKDDFNSLASFSFFNDELYGVISDQVNGNIVVGRVDHPGNKNEYVIYSDRNLRNTFLPFCNSADKNITDDNFGNLQTINTTRCVRFYYEVDHDIYVNKNNSVVNTTNWMTAVHNNVQTLYANDNITVALSQVFVWSANDPFTGANSSDQLALFRTTRVTFNGDVAQLVAHDNNNGGLAATINGLCNSNKYSYADVDYTYSNVLTYSWTIEVIAHEFGHLLGSPHTHNCSWPGGAIDNCGPVAGYPTEGGCANGPIPPNGGTIMSYCHLTGTGINFTNGFGPFPGMAIQNCVNNASCLGVSCAVCPVPAHNDCSSPASLTVTTNCVYTSASLCAATQSIAPIVCNGKTAAHAYDVWYSVVPGQTTMVINCQSGTTTDAVVGLYSGACGSLSLISCADATTTGGAETISATSLIIGNTYYLRVYDFNGATTGTDFGICATQSCPAAPNNSCANAAALTINSSCNFVSGDLCSATQSISPSTCSNYTAPAGLDLWYTVVPAQNNIRLTAQSGANTDIVLGIYSGICGGLSLIKCVDSTSNGGIEILNVGVTTGTTYYVRVYDYGGNQFGTNYQLCAQYLCNPPNAPTGAAAVNSTICAGTNTSLNVSGTLSPGATWKWYTGSCGGTAAGTGVSISVSPATTTTYYVRAENGTCYSNCSSTGVAVTAIPVAATSATPVPAAICAGASSVISVAGSLSAGASWKWYTVSCGGTVAGTGSSITVSPGSSTTYFVRAENGNCFSTCKNAVVNVSASPAAPSSANSLPASVCPGTSTSLSVTGSLSAGANWRWYSGSCGGALVGIGSSLTVSPTSTTTYYVRAENAICFSSCKDVTVSVTSISNPTGANSSTSAICNGSSSTLSVSGSLSGGATWHWYTGSCGAVDAGTGSSINVSPSSTTTYYVRAENGSCFSTCQNTQIAVTQIPNDPSAVNASPPDVCGGSSSTLSVTGVLSPGATWRWYSNSCGGNSTGSGNNTTVSPSSTRTYYVRAENGNCFSNCQPTTVTVNPTPDDPNSASPTFALICDGNFSTLTVTGNLSSGASWEWYTGSCGGTSQGSGTSLAVSPSLTTRYYVRAEIGNCTSDCESTTINVLPSPGIPQPVNASSTNLCGGASAVLTENGTLTSGSNWYWYVGTCGGTLIGQGTSIIVSPVANQTYYVRSENANCQSSCLNTTITTSPAPAQPVIVTGNDTLFVQTNYDGYEWFFGIDQTVFNFSGNDQSLPLTNNGYYFVVITDDNGCTSSSDTIFYNVLATTNHSAENLISVYPNPVTNNLNIETRFSAFEKSEIKIFNSLGSLVYYGVLKNEKINTVSLKDYSAGMYQIMISVGEKFYPIKVIKE